MDSIVNGLFPKDEIFAWPSWTGQHVFPEATCYEVREISCRILLGKAPGPDGVPDMVIKEVVVMETEILMDLFNSCLKQGLFPCAWKVSKLVLLRKGDKPLENPSSYRPICLLNTVGKLFERLIKRRMEKHLQENDDLNERQFCIRKDRSTMDAIREVMNVVEQRYLGPCIPESSA